MMFLLSIDIGTSAVKAGVISEAGALVSSGHVGLSFDTDATGSEDIASRWLTAIEELLAGLPNVESVAGVVVSGNGPTLVPLAHDGSLSGPTLLWLDPGDGIEGEPSFFLPKIAAMRRLQPAAYERTRWFISCPEYVSFVLTGIPITITPSAEFCASIWNRDSIRRYDIDPETLPPFATVGDRVGKVQRAASTRFGIPVATPVFAGGSDFLMSLLGTATISPGRTCDRAGTSEGINHCSETNIESPSLRSLPHVVPGLYNVAGILASTGRIFEWFRRISGQERKPYEKMLREIAEISSDRLPVFLPSLHRGDTWEFSAAAFMDLEPHHGVVDMGRSVVESIGYSIRDVIETLEANGCLVAELRVSGGQARNSVWNQMKADMTGRRIIVPKVVDAELLGDAVAGFVGLGAFDELGGASMQLYQTASEYEPASETTARYEDGYRLFCEKRERILGNHRNSVSANA